MNYEDVIEKLEAISINLKSYTDYPQAATNNAKKAIKYNNAVAAPNINSQYIINNIIAGNEYSIIILSPLYGC